MSTNIAAHQAVLRTFYLDTVLTDLPFLRWIYFFPYQQEGLVYGVKSRFRNR